MGVMLSRTLDLVASHMGDLLLGVYAVTAAAGLALSVWLAA